MTPIWLALIGLALALPVPAVLARATWPHLAPAAGIVLWQSLALAASSALAVLAAALRSPIALAIAGVNLIGQATYVIGGLAVVGAPASVFRALAFAPILMLWKLGIYLRIATGRGPRTWTRTRRS